MTKTSTVEDLLAAGPLPVRAAQCFRQEGWHVWCGSVVRDAATGRWHLFYSRWPEATGFEGWVTHSEIARAEGDTLHGSFEYRETVFMRDDSDASAGAVAWDAHCFHNVVVKQYGGRYFMYYMGNRSDRVTDAVSRDWWDHRNHQRIGIAVADSPEGPWRRRPVPAIDVGAPGAWDSLMVSNPAITDTTDGRWLMIYKGVTTDGPAPFGGRVLHGVAWADAPDGPFIRQPGPILDQPGVSFGFEDPCLWRQAGGGAGADRMEGIDATDGKYYCIVKDMQGCLSPTGESALLLLESSDGVDWSPAASPVVIGRRLIVAGEDGAQREEKMKRVERPQWYSDEQGNRALIVAVLPEEGLSYNVRLAYPATQGGAPV